MQKWFYGNHMVLAPGKCYYILKSNHDELDKINVNVTEITSSNNEELLVVLTNKRLSLDVHFT